MRTRNPITVLGPDGKPLAGASVHTTVRSTGADASVYEKETGSEPGSNPAITDVHGKVVQWLERGAYSSTVTAEGMEGYVEEWDSAPGSDGAVDSAWIEDGQVGTPQLANEAVTDAKVVKGRTLVSTETTYSKSAPAEKTPVKPSSSRMAFVTLNIRSKVAEGTGIIVSVGAVVVGETYLTGPAGSRGNATLSFLVPPGSSWQWERETGTPEAVIATTLLL